MLILSSLENTRFGAAKQRAALSNQNFTTNTPCEKTQDWPPCFLLKLQHSSEAGKREIKTIPIKTNNLKLSKIARPPRTSDISFNQMKQITCKLTLDLDSNNCAPVTAVTHSGQIENSWGKRRGSEFRSHPSIPDCPQGSLVCSFGTPKIRRICFVGVCIQEDPKIVLNVR